MEDARRRRWTALAFSRILVCFFPHITNLEENLLGYLFTTITLHWNRIFMFRFIKSNQLGTNHSFCSWQVFGSGENELECSFRTSITQYHATRRSVSYTTWSDPSSYVCVCASKHASPSLTSIDAPGNRNDGFWSYLIRTYIRGSDKCNSARRLNLKSSTRSNEAADRDRFL